uniref:Uncharacterized protein n=1 Tax=viral metagenome TaxID=1070528 RepID=A0A6H1ZRI0_9ZZZZ
MLFRDPITDLTTEQVRDLVIQLRKERRGDPEPLLPTEDGEIPQVTKKRKTKSTKGPSKTDIMDTYTKAFATGKLPQADYIRGLNDPLGTWEELKEVCSV